MCKLCEIDRKPKEAELNIVGKSQNGAEFSLTKVIILLPIKVRIFAAISDAQGFNVWRIHWKYSSRIPILPTTCLPVITSGRKRIPTRLCKKLVLVLYTSVRVENEPQRTATIFILVLLPTVQKQTNDKLYKNGWSCFFRFEVKINIIENLPSI